MGQLNKDRTHPNVQEVAGEVNKDRTGSNVQEVEGQANKETCLNVQEVARQVNWERTSPDVQEVVGQVNKDRICPNVQEVNWEKPHPLGSENTQETGVCILWVSCRSYNTYQSLNHGIFLYLRN